MTLRSVLRGSSFGAPLLLATCLWGCTAEPQAPASSTQTSGQTDNHPPAIIAAKIFPVDFTRDTVLRVDFQSEDADGDRITYRYKWLVNDMPAPGETSEQFSPTKLKQGDRIAVEVIPNDGKVDGVALVTEAVIVGNTAPEIGEIYLEPSPIYRGDILRVRVVAVDPDGDPIILSYKWLHNGEEIAGMNSDTLETKDFRKKDILVVYVTASDGQATRGSMASLPVTIQNTAPRFTSNPSGEMKDGQYMYTATAIDPDGDPIDFELKEAPAGMTVDAATGRLTWKLTPDSKGKHRVVLLAKDNDGGVAQQEFELDGQLPAQAAQ